MTMIRVAIIEDHDLFRAMLSEFINKHADFVVLMSVASVTEFGDFFRGNPMPIDILLLDYQLPDSEPEEALKNIQSIISDLKIVILTAFLHPDLIEEMIGKGVKGFLSKSIKPDLFFGALKSIHMGAIVVEHEEQLVTDFNFIEHPFLIPEKAQKLSKREINFLKLCLNDEYTYKMIASKLKISPKTLDKYRENLFRKLNVKSKTGLAMYAIKRGLLK